MTNHPRRSRRRYRITATLDDGTQHWFYKGPDGRDTPSWCTGWLINKASAYVYNYTEGVRYLEFVKARYDKGYMQFELEEIL